MSANINSAAPAAPGAGLEPTERTPWAKLMTDDEYYPFLVKKNIRPAMWRWADVQPALQEVAADPLRRADRRFVTAVNADTGEMGGVLPSIFLGFQIINPGEHIVPHRHNSYALYHIIQGSGFSIVAGHKFEWTRGDTFACSPWASHEHYNSGDEQAIQYVIQDMPARAMERNLMWEEPIGRMFHMVEGNLPHSSGAVTPAK
jgi:gentisate 1,2-dioxygenase